MSVPLNVEPIRREPLAAEVARRLVDYLLSGGIVPGARIPSERQLAEAFGVGRSAVREAIAALTLIGLIEVRHGKLSALHSSTWRCFTNRKIILLKHIVCATTPWMVAAKFRVSTRMTAR